MQTFHARKISMKVPKRGNDFLDRSSEPCFNADSLQGRTTILNWKTRRRIGGIWADWRPGQSQTGIGSV